MMCTVFNKSSITEPVCIVLWRQSGLVMHNVIVVLDLGWYLWSFGSILHVSFELRPSWLVNHELYLVKNHKWACRFFFLSGQCIWYRILNEVSELFALMPDGLWPLVMCVKTFFKVKLQLNFELDYGIYVRMDCLRIFGRCNFAIQLKYMCFILGNVARPNSQATHIAVRLWWPA
jgi:hypothetical protein